MCGRRSIAALVTGLVAIGGAPLSAAPQGGGVIHRDSVPAPALRRNMVGDPAWNRMSIYLPPGYNTPPRRRFPVLYFLHGFDADDRALVKGAYQNLNIRISMDSLIRSGVAREMIIVMPSARNAYNGSFYTNSPVTGNWELFITRDLVNYVDRKYRTLKTRTARGLAGHSMGGYGALRVGMRHSEAFSAVYALSACCLDFADWDTPTYEMSWRSSMTVRSWDGYARAGFVTNLIMAFGAANAPDLSNPPLYISLPYLLRRDSLILDQRIARRWSVRPLAMVREYATNLRRLEIAFDAGTGDGFRDIPIRANELDELLSSLRISHSFELYEGGHGDQIRSRIEGKMLPFFSRVLEAAR
ncbi:MAG TPA: alpha/beta hydrolase-fold protein [Rhodothermia bacterium]|nr:alpha/beta hydrolase-fold protein [Rhodothermia bacterium]